MILESQDDQLMLMAAHRYCLERQTYIAETARDVLKRAWPQLNDTNRRLVIKDTVQALICGRAGDPKIDAPGWREFARWACEQMSKADQAWMRVFTAHWGPWPLDEPATTEALP